MKLEVGQKLPVELRTAISIFLKNADYVLVAEESKRSEYTIRNFMKEKNTHELGSEEAKEAAEILISHTVKKAKSHIQNLQAAMAVIEKYNQPKEVAA